MRPLVHPWGKDASNLGGAPAGNIIYVEAAANLIQAVIDAPPNSIVVLLNAGAPIRWVKSASFNIQKDTGPGTRGVAVVLPLDQVISLDLYAPIAGIHWIGGTWRGDWSTTLGSAVLVRQASAAGRCERLSWRGGHFLVATNCLSLTALHDFEIDRCVMEDYLADAVQTVSVVRGRITNNVSTGCGFQPKTCWLPNADPSENISASACSSAGGQWSDAAHCDFIQMRAAAIGPDPSYTSDMRVSGNQVLTYVQGINTYGLNNDEGERFWIEGNTVGSIASAFYFSRMQDLAFIGNTSMLGFPNPGYGTPSPQSIFHVNGGVRFRTGLNSFVLPPSGISGGYNPTGPVNGDAVLEPVPPAFLLPDNIGPFLPASAPTHRTEDGAALALSAPNIMPFAAPPLGNGVRVAIMAPSWSNTGVAGGFSREWRWQVNSGSGWADVAGAGAQSWVMNGVSPGDQVRGLARLHNGVAWSDWVASPARTVLG